MSMAKNGRAPETTGLLLSGGLDSSILLVHLLEQGRRVQPLYMAIDCVWQQAERRALQQFIEALANPAVEDVVELQMPVGDLYGDHWSITGRDVPDKNSPDEAVSLWGRNPLLLVKAMLWCSLHDVPQLALATLESNPFTDATPEFFLQFEQALSTATEMPVQIRRPFAGSSKQQILEFATSLPLHLTFSCLAPQDGLHCGDCNKCAERAQVLQLLPDGDPTIYASNMSLANQSS